MKKNRASILLIIIAVIGFTFNNYSSNLEENVSIIPKPNKIILSDGHFLINSNTKIIIVGSSKEEINIAKYFNHKLENAVGYKLEISNENIDTENSIILNSMDNGKLGAEGYTLVVNKNGVKITGTNAGQFYGIQSILQLLPAEIFGNKIQENLELTVPFVEIEDAPRFEWRGMHLDVCRHFFSVEFIKKYIDYLAMHKMNTFHWHLTEDQGWRIEIKKYPKLSEVSAYRNETIIGHHNTNPQKFDGKRYGGIYTQEEIREVVKYASDRFITVVPEIELPGHSVAALTAYPELSCTGGPFEVRTSWGISDDIYCAGNEKTFEFLENVLSEVVELFPSKYIHIGGDEAPKDRWEECEKCQARIKKEGLHDEHELQSYFITRMEKFLNSKGKQIIGWDEILEGGLAPNEAVMSWRGNDGGIAAAKSKHKVVMSPNTNCYFDHYQTENRENEPLAIGGFLPLEKVYSFNPIPPELTEEEGKYIIGAQGNVWTEYIATPESVEYMAFPRMSALAEVVWSEDSNKDFDEFKLRMEKHYKRLDAIGTNYFGKQILEKQ